MSYCRFSSDDFRCDLYCYKDINGNYITHVALNRYKGDIPRVDWESPELLIQRQKQDEFLKTAKIEKIGLPYDNQTFSDETIDDFYDRIKMLRAVGYRVPDYTLTIINDERNDTESKPDYILTIINDEERADRC